MSINLLNVSTLDELRTLYRKDRVTMVRLALIKNNWYLGRAAEELVTPIQTVRGIIQRDPELSTEYKKKSHKSGRPLKGDK